MSLLNRNIGPEEVLFLEVSLYIVESGVKRL